MAIVIGFCPRYEDKFFALRRQEGTTTLTIGRLNIIHVKNIDYLDMMIAVGIGIDAMTGMKLNHPDDSYSEFIERASGHMVDSHEQHHERIIKLKTKKETK